MTFFSDTWISAIILILDIHKFFKYILYKNILYYLSLSFKI